MFSECTQSIESLSKSVYIKTFFGAYLLKKIKITHIIEGNSWKLDINPYLCHII